MYEVVSILMGILDIRLLFYSPVYSDDLVTYQMSRDVT